MGDDRGRGSHYNQRSGLDTMGDPRSGDQPARMGDGTAPGETKDEVKDAKIHETDHRASDCDAGDPGVCGDRGERISEPEPARTELVSGESVGDREQIAKSAIVRHKTTSTVLDASSSNYQDASSSKDPQVVDLADIWGIASDPVWKPKKFVRNESYPKVTATGYYFQNHSAGFVLIRRATNEYVGFYTKQAIKELEEEYGKPIRKAKSKRSSSRGTS